jgi:hypothetical protein
MTPESFRTAEQRFARFALLLRKCESAAAKSRVERWERLSREKVGLQIEIHRVPDIQVADVVFDGLTNKRPKAMEPIDSGFHGEGVALGIFAPRKRSVERHSPNIHHNSDGCLDLLSPGAPFVHRKALRRFARCDSMNYYFE